MTIILLSQGPTKHSRIGNSLVWMSKISHWLNELNLTSCFPWAIENYYSYFSPSSKWLVDSQQSRELFQHNFSTKLTASSLSQHVRSIEHEFEKQNLLDAFDWKSIAYKPYGKNVFLVSGNADIASEELIEQIYKHEFVILHEPFSFDYNVNSRLIGEDYASISPRMDLFENQRDYIRTSSPQLCTAGFHIRRGDYSNWRNGAYYYKDDFWIREVKQSIQEGFTPWIYSNDLSNEMAIALKSLGALISDGSFEIDFTRLMLMDKIYGPPSTFTGMAANISKNVLGRNIELCFYGPIL